MDNLTPEEKELLKKLLEKSKMQEVGGKKKKNRRSKKHQQQTQQTQPPKPVNSNRSNQHGVPVNQIPRKQNVFEEIVKTLNIKHDKKDDEIEPSPRVRKSTLIDIDCDVCNKPFKVSYHKTFASESGKKLERKYICDKCITKRK